MSGNKEVQAAAAPSVGGKKKKEEKRVSDVKRIKELLRGGGTTRQQLSQLRLARPRERLMYQKNKKQFIRAINNPWIERLHKRKKNTSPLPQLSGKIFTKSLRLWKEALPLLRLTRKKGLPRARISRPVRGLKWKTTGQWIQAERTWEKRRERQKEKRAQEASKRRLEAKKKKAEGAPVEEKKKKEKKPKKEGEKEGEKDEKKVVIKTPSVLKKKKAQKKRVTLRLRKSITPGTILITLLPPNLGRRVIFLKQLPSGYLLCAGPRCLNTMPLHRIRPTYVIATSTKLDISKVKLGKINEKELFRQKRHKKSRSDPKVFFKEEKKDEKVKNDRPLVAATKAIDKQLLPLIKKVPYLAKYLRARFSLGRATYPHLIKF